VVGEGGRARSQSRDADGDDEDVPALVHVNLPTSCLWAPRGYRRTRSGCGPAPATSRDRLTPRVAELLGRGDELARLYDLIEIVLTERLLKT
jgi:hypothetical protein